MVELGGWGGVVEVMVKMGKLKRMLIIYSDQVSIERMGKEKQQKQNMKD